MSRLLIAILVSCAIDKRHGRRLATRTQGALPELADAPPELTDVTSYMDSGIVTLEGYRCCCDKSKEGAVAGYKDMFRGFVTGLSASDRADYCIVLKTSVCGDVKVTPNTVKAHSHGSVHDATCEIPKSQLADFMEIVGVMANTPEVWKATSGLDWIREKENLEIFTESKRFPDVLKTFLHELDEDESKKQLLRDTWTQAEQTGLILVVPPGVSSTHQVHLEEGDTLVFAYRVQEKDINFKITHIGRVQFYDEDDAPVHEETVIMRESLYSRSGSTSIVYWKPVGGFDVEDVELVTGLVDVKPKKRMTVNLVWDNSASWYHSKTVMAMVGILQPKPPITIEPQVQAITKIEPEVEAITDIEPEVPVVTKKHMQKWKKKLTAPKPMDSRIGSQSLSKSFNFDLLEDYGHPLDKKQCNEAKERIEGKQGFMEDIALTGYLKEIGQSPTKDIIASVKEDIEKDCDISSTDLTVKSDAEFLTPEQCQEAKERAGSKSGMFLELVLKAYVKEIGKKPSPKMINRATEQLSEGCEDEANTLTKPQCLGIKTIVEQADGPTEQLDEISRGLQAFGQPPTAKRVTETAKQISNACPVQGVSPDQAPEVVPEKTIEPPKKVVPVAEPLDPGECQQAKLAIKGQPTMFAGILLGKWLKEIGKDGSPKAVDFALAQLQGDCGGAPTITDTMVIDEMKKIEEKNEKDASVSSGTIRRKDFCEDPRFAKYRMMKKIRQPEGSVIGKITMDKGDLLKTGLTELELDCFVKLLFEKVGECNVAPPKGGRVLTADFIDDERVKKYKMMHKLKQPRGAAESRMTMDKADLLKAGLTEADLDCLLKLMYDGVEECDASPAGKVLGPEFVQTDNEFFKKYRMMKKLKQPSGAVEGRIKMDMADLTKLGFTKTDMDCFIKLLFEEVDKCICGPAERSEKQSKEARGLAVAKDVHERLTSLLDGDNGLLPGVLPSLDWATAVFEVNLPTKKEEEEKPDGKTVDKKPEMEMLIDGKTHQNLAIILKQFPEDMIFEGYLAEIGRAEWSFLRGKNEEPLSTDLETLQRAVITVSDSVCEEVKPNVAKITEKFDQPHRFVKALISVKYTKEEPQLNEIMTCMLQEKKFSLAIQNKADDLSNLQVYYKHAATLVGTMSAAVNGFIVQLLNARIVAAKDGASRVSKESFEQYDTVLRKFRQASGSDDESPNAMVPLLALNNVIIQKANRLRVGLVRSNPELAKTLSPTYLELFKKYLHTVIEAEKQQFLIAKEEPPLSFDECEKAKEAQKAAKNPMFEEMALNNFLKGIKKTGLKAKVLEQLKGTCKKTAVQGPLTDQECQDALEVIRNTPNPMMQGIKLSSFFKEIGKSAQKKEAEKQARAGCPSDKPAEPLYMMSSLMDQCKVVAEIKEEPSSRNSVRGAMVGVKETQKKVQECLAVMPALKQAAYESLMDEGEVVIDIAKQVQNSVFEAMIQSQGPFLPHDKKGAVDNAKLWELLDNLPQPGGNEDLARVRGENGVPSKYSLSDFLDDETVRYATKRICEALLEK